MIASEFLIELEAIAGHFNWQLVPDVPLFTLDRRSRNRLRLRALCKAPLAGVTFEPIGAVYHIRSGGTYLNDSWMEAADRLDLSLMDAGDITAAANDVTWQPTTEGRAPDRYIQTLRRGLIAAVGLEGVQASIPVRRFGIRAG